MRTDELIGKYIRLRDKKAQMKKEFEAQVAPLDAALRKVEAILLKSFDELGVESMRTEEGTAYAATRSSTSVADRDAFFGWVIQQEAWEMLESRANKTAVIHWRDAEGMLPPGINYYEERTINVRRGK